MTTSSGPSPAEAARQAAAGTAVLDPAARPGSMGRTLAGGAAAQLGAKALHLVLNVVSTLAVVRYLAPGAYGIYALVLTVTTLAALGADFGLPKLAIREITARHGGSDAGAGADEDRVIGTIVVIRLALAVAAVGVVQLVLLVLRQPAEAYPAAAVASLTGVGEAVVAAVVVVFQVRLLQHYEAFVRASTELLETAAVVALVAVHASLTWLFVPPAAGAGLAAAAVVLLARRRFATRLRFDRLQARRLLTAAAPIAPALIVALLYRKFDSLALAALRPSRDVGIYGSAAQPVEYAFLSTALLMNVVFPLMSAAHGQGDLPRFAQLYQRGAETLVLLTVILPVLLLFVARPLAVQVFGRPYAAADVPLILLSTAMVPLVVTVWQSLALLLGGHQKVTLYYSLAALAVSAVLSLVLVSTLGVLGAGTAAVGTALTVLTASTVAVRRLMHVRLAAAPLLRIGAAAALAAGVLAALSPAGLPWPLRAAVGLLAYGLAVRLTGAHRSLVGVAA